LKLAEAAALTRQKQDKMKWEKDGVGENASIKKAGGSHLIMDEIEVVRQDLR
jgi:hypothetical protein